MKPTQKRSWAEVSLAAIEHNYREIRRTLPEGCRYLGVVKADAYGHGALPVARRLVELGAEYLAVATPEEALELRANGIAAPILLLGAASAEYAPELAREQITAAVECGEKGRALAAQLAPGQRLKIHIKLDTGMGRLGFPAGEEQALREAAQVMALPGLETEGCFTHFSVSDEPGQQEAYTRAQFAAFLAAAKRLEEESGRSLALRHCANSGAVLHYPEYALDMVRPGLLTYGLYPGAERGGLSLRPAMALKTRIAALTHHKKGESISYGRAFTAGRDCTLAVLPLGYADGLHRCLSGRLEMLLHGQRCAQVGRICMDMCMLDVTDVPGVAVGDVVTVFGRDGDAFVPVEELAEKAGTISYEMTCALSARVPRVYTE